MLDFPKGVALTSPFGTLTLGPCISMYLKHYGLNRQPFNLSTDPDFLWTGEKHRAAMEALKEGILESRGFVLLTGEVGTGKTTLVNAFPRSNEIAAITVTIPDPDMDSLDFCNFLASEFGMKRKFASKEEFVQHFKGFLLRSFASYKKVLVIIDEAQRLNHVLLEEIRQLSAIEMAGRRMLKIYFVGQPEFCTMLMEEYNAAVRYEIVAAYNIEPLEAKETERYVSHRLSVAGAKRTIFTPRAVAWIHAVTGGFPRTINVLCDHCLLRGFGTGVKVVDVNIVAVCAKALSLRPIAKSAENFVFPFPLRAPVSGGDLLAQQKPKAIYKSLGAAAVSLALILTSGYLVYHFGLYEHLLQTMQRMLAPFLP